MTEGRTIRCGHCHDHHETVHDVRECSDAEAAWENQHSEFDRWEGELWAELMSDWPSA